MIIFAIALTQNQITKEMKLNRRIWYRRLYSSTKPHVKRKSLPIELHMCKIIKKWAIKQMIHCICLCYLDVCWLSLVSNSIEGEGLAALSQSMKTNPKSLIFAFGETVWWGYMCGMFRIHSNGPFKTDV